MFCITSTGPVSIFIIRPLGVRRCGDEVYQRREGKSIQSKQTESR